jgi:hypothetical protein
MRKDNQKGQALIELIIFLPLMFMFYSMISGFANAINGSINQQKIARSYFYYRVQGNSMVPKPDADQTYMNWKTFGMFYVGWKDKFISQKPISPCYKLSIPLAPGATDNCEDRYMTKSTMFIRVQTVYGICGASYARSDTFVSLIPDFSGGEFMDVVKKESCYLTR